MISVFLFFVGLICSIPVVKKEIRFFLFYPLWVWKRLKLFLQTEPTFLKLFLFIFSFNSVSLFFNIVSGISVVLPCLFSFLIGLNVGIIGYHEGGWKALFGMFVAPHVIFELPAAWISTTLGMQIGREILLGSTPVAPIVQQCLLVYVQLIFPLLFIAGLIEAALINFMMKQLSGCPRT
ncbi:stage II sporulation protein M [candidate division KSB1 bacterium]|nr:stage II sporulation protein M [candidate division KSB1 bacterium]MBL7095477.1 stage II sporulation protein M [candidate division KSB1 bacterium]